MRRSKREGGACKEEVVTTGCAVEHIAANLLGKSSLRLWFWALAHSGRRRRPRESRKIDPGQSEGEARGLVPGLFVVREVGDVSLKCTLALKNVSSLWFVCITLFRSITVFYMGLTIFHRIFPDIFYIHTKFIMFFDFYRLNVHNKPRVALVNL